MDTGFINERDHIAMKEYTANVREEMYEEQITSLKERIKELENNYIDVPIEVGYMDRLIQINNVVNSFQMSERGTIILPFIVEKLKRLSDVRK